MMDSIWVDVGMTMAGLSLFLFIYTFPSFVAYMRYHKHLGRIMFVNVIFGFLVLPWFATLLWAALTNPKEQMNE